MKVMAIAFDAVILSSAAASEELSDGCVGNAQEWLAMSRRPSRSGNHTQPDLFAKEPDGATRAAFADRATNAASSGASSRRERGIEAVGPAKVASSELLYADMSAPPKRAPHLLDVRAAAAWLGLSKSTLDKMRCYGVGPRFIRATGKAVRYDPADLAAFAEGRRQSRTTDELPA